MPSKTQAHYHILSGRAFINNKWDPWGTSIAGFQTVDTVNYLPSYSTGNWRQRIKLRVSATTGLYGEEHRVVLTNADRATWKGHLNANPLSVSGSDQAGGFSYGANGPTDPSAFLIQSVKNQAKMNAVNKIRAAQTSLKGLVAAGEFGDTVRLVNGSGKKLFSGVCDYLNSFDKKFARNLTPQNLTRAISRRWLEYVFGWKPFISDIDDGMRAINRYLDVPKPSRAFRAFATSDEMNHGTRYSISRAWHTFVFQPMLQYTYGCRIYGAVSLQRPLSGGSMAHEFGIKLDEFFPTVYELIPFSFLADYFVNIGAVISAASLNTSSIAWINIGELRSCNRKTELVSVDLQPPTGWTTDESYFRLGPLYQHRRSSKTRAAFAESLIPDLEFQIPGSGTKWANMSALAHLKTDASLRLRK